ncbi:MAG: hypothetical protein QG604_531 [Candidatus Dependentiae bacterium]|nr:hypothetical protein [Candidatus Dependentiae bacterium]
MKKQILLLVLGLTMGLSLHASPPTETADASTADTGYVTTIKNHLKAHDGAYAAGAFGAGLTSFAEMYRTRPDGKNYFANYQKDENGESFFARLKKKDKKAWQALLRGIVTTGLIAGGGYYGIKHLRSKEAKKKTAKKKEDEDVGQDARAAIPVSVKIENLTTAYNKLPATLSLTKEQIAEWVKAQEIKQKLQEQLRKTRIALAGEIQADAQDDVTIRAVGIEKKIEALEGYLAKATLTVAQKEELIALLERIKTASEALKAAKGQEIPLEGPLKAKQLGELTDDEAAQQQALAQKHMRAMLTSTLQEKYNLLSELINGNEGFIKKLESFDRTFARTHQEGVTTETQRADIEKLAKQLKEEERSLIAAAKKLAETRAATALAPFIEEITRIDTVLEVHDMAHAASALSREQATALRKLRQDTLDRLLDALNAHPDTKPLAKTFQERFSKAPETARYDYARQARHIMQNIRQAEVIKEKQRAKLEKLRLELDRKPYAYLVDEISRERAEILGRSPKDWERVHRVEAAERDNLRPAKEKAKKLSDLRQLYRKSEYQQGLTLEQRQAAAAANQRKLPAELAAARDANDQPLIAEEIAYILKSNEEYDRELSSSGGSTMSDEERDLRETINNIFETMEQADTMIARTSDRDRAVDMLFKQRGAVTDGHNFLESLALEDAKFLLGNRSAEEYADEYIQNLKILFPADWATGSELLTVLPPSKNPKKAKALQKLKLLQKVLQDTVPSPEERQALLHRAYYARHLGATPSAELDPKGSYEAWVRELPAGYAPTTELSNRDEIYQKKKAEKEARIAAKAAGTPIAPPAVAPRIIPVITIDPTATREEIERIWRENMNTVEGRQALLNAMLTLHTTRGATPVDPA